MQVELLKRYSQIRRDRKALEDEEEMLKEKIMGEMKDKSMETIYGKFTIAEKQNYKYSDKIKALEDKVKIAKINEQETGKAKLRITKYLTYKA